MKINWETLSTVVLTAVTTILATCGVITTSESTQLTTTGAAAITGIAGFVTAILVCVKAHKKNKDEVGK